MTNFKVRFGVVRELFVQRASMKRWQYPSRANSMYSLFILVLSMPLALVLFVCLLCRRVRRDPLHVFVLATDGEFAHFVELVESMRFRGCDKRTVVLILSRWKHHGLGDLYKSAFGWRMIWSTRASRLLQQAIMVQPSLVVCQTRMTRVSNARNRQLSNQLLPLTEKYIELRRQILREQGCSKRQYVTMAVYTLQYELERNPEYLFKTKMLESEGHKLIDSITYLQDRQIDVILLGSLDQGKAHLPIDIPRLSNFGSLGGAEEVALASGCEYFWTDGVGAWWLTKPFLRPVLFTNQYHLPQGHSAWPQQHLVLPLRYRTPDGNYLTLQQIFSYARNLTKLVLRGELEAIRNSSDEIVEAHREMCSRIYGTWENTHESQVLSRRAKEIISRFTDCHLIDISQDFLCRHPEFLE